ncbi:MAG: YbdD/YjiX family protein [Pseudomonadales bacterium]|nr:YbdD/YjiX family protein [Pseudomonadales bacterium]
MFIHQLDYVRRLIRALIGAPDYQAYYQHRQAAHPGEPVMSEQAFFMQRQSSRYGSGTIKRCPC